MTKRKIERTSFAFINKIMVSRPTTAIMPSKSFISSITQTFLATPLSLSLSSLSSLSSSWRSSSSSSSSSIKFSSTVYSYFVIIAIFILLSSSTHNVNAENSGIIKSHIYNERIISSTTPITPSIFLSTVTPLKLELQSTISPASLSSSSINKFKKTFTPSLKLYEKNIKLNNTYTNYNNNNSSSDNNHNNDNSVNHNNNTKTTTNDNKKTNNKNNLWSVGNELWDNIISDCYRYPTFSCFQKNVYSYLDKTLDINDVNITSNMKLYRNKVDFTKYTKEVNSHHEQSEDNQQQQKQQKQRNWEPVHHYQHQHQYQHHQNDEHQYHDNNEHNNDPTQPQHQKLVDDNLDNEIPNESRSDSPIEEVTNALYGKTVKFAITHDLEIKLPKIFFNGAIIRISPRSIEGNGALVKLEIMPKTEIEEKNTGRIFKKKIQQFIKSKLLLSFLAILLIIKLIKVKIFWLLPIIVGVSTAKKLILKFLLFLFPALSHIFKLCSYYHDSYHATKYHHHHHHIKHHHHTLLPPWYHEHEHHPGHPSIIQPNTPEFIFTDPPKVHPVEFLHAQQPISPYESDWENSGPGLGSEYISDIHRNAHVDGPYFRPKIEDANEIHAWGLGTTHNPAATSHSYNVQPFINEPSGIISQKLKAHNGPVYSPQRSTPPLAAAQIAAQYVPAVNHNSAKDIQRAQAQAKEALRIQAEQRLIAQQQKILQQQPFIQNAEPLTPKGYDPFYSPILAKIDKILFQIGFTDDSCKERLVCSMYKNPNRYSPHSNFVSAELSRDTNELEKPSSTNAAVIKFYRYVQAARDGQEQRDCLRLYPHCTINTE